MINEYVIYLGLILNYDKIKCVKIGFLLNILNEYCKYLENVKLVLRFIYSFRDYI